jgi:hypothetical protein
MTKYLPKAPAVFGCLHGLRRFLFPFPARMLTPLEKRTL